MAVNVGSGSPKSVMLVVFDQTQYIPTDTQLSEDSVHSKLPKMLQVEVLQAPGVNEGLPAQDTPSVGPPGDQVYSPQTYSRIRNAATFTPYPPNTGEMHTYGSAVQGLAPIAPGSTTPAGNAYVVMADLKKANPIKDMFSSTPTWEIDLDTIRSADPRDIPKNVELTHKATVHDNIRESKGLTRIDYPVDQFPVAPRPVNVHSAAPQYNADPVYFGQPNDPAFDKENLDKAQEYRDHVASRVGERADVEHQNPSPSAPGVAAPRSLEQIMREEGGWGSPQPSGGPSGGFGTGLGAGGGFGARTQTPQQPSPDVGQTGWGGLPVPERPSRDDNQTGWGDLPNSTPGGRRGGFGAGLPPISTQQPQSTGQFGQGGWGSTPAPGNAGAPEADKDRGWDYGA